MIKKQVTRLFLEGGGGKTAEWRFKNVEREYEILTIEGKQAAYKLTLQNPTGEAKASTKRTKSQLNKLECITHQEACDRLISNSDDDVMNGIPHELLSAVQETTAQINVIIKAQQI